MPVKRTRRDETSAFILRRHRRTRLLLFAAAVCLMLVQYVFAFGPTRFGPTPYSFLVFWFAAFCLLVYLRDFDCLRKLALAVDDELTAAQLSEDDREAILFPRPHARFMTLQFPAVTVVLMVAAPWSFEGGILALFYLVWCVPFLMMTGRLSRKILRRTSTKLRPPYVEYAFAALFFQLPIAISTSSALLVVILIVFAFGIQVVRVFLSTSWMEADMKSPTL